jgi:hypothetical protein
MKVIAIAICLIGLFANDMLAQYGITKVAKVIRIGESHNANITSERPSDFKIVTPKDGDLTISFESIAENIIFALYNDIEYVESFFPASHNIVTGIVTLAEFSSVCSATGLTGFGNDDKIVMCTWNSTTKKFEGNFTFRLDSGCYYLRFIRSRIGLNNVKLSISMKDLNGKNVNAK